MGRYYRRRRGFRISGYGLAKALNSARKIKRRYRDAKIGRRFRKVAWEARKANTKGTDANIAVFGKTWADASDLQKAYRVGARYYGEGDYRNILKYASRGIGALAGGASGYLNGGIAGVSGGAASGWGRGAEFSKYMGWGDYGPVTGNNLVEGSGSQQTIQHMGGQHDDFVVSSTEFIQNVTASGSSGSNSAFELRTFPLNPGMATTFPFFSQVAQNYEMYEPCGIIFQFKPLSGEYATSSQSLGKLVLATNYDVDAPAFINSIQMENYASANSTKPSCGALHGVECARTDRSQIMYFVRSGATSRDKTFTDIGTFYLGTEGVPIPSGQTSVLVGELWVTYTFRLSRKNLYGSLLGQSISQDMFTLQPTSSQLGANAVAKSTNQIGCTIGTVSATAFSVTFPVNIALGTYVIWFRGRPDAAISSSIQPISNYSNISFYQIFGSIPVGEQDYGTGGASAGQQCHMLAIIKVEAPGLLQASLRVNVGSAFTASTATSQSLFYITQVNQIPFLTSS